MPMVPQVIAACSCRRPSCCGCAGRANWPIAPTCRSG